MSEPCVRCGEVDEDRRTLFMSCLYAMDELGLPFERQTLLRPEEHARFEVVTKPGVIPLPTGGSVNVTSAEVKTNATLHPREFFTLRVCKDCRGDWLQAIKTWFDQKKVQSQDEQHCDAEGNVRNIPIRELGAIKMISRPEWDRRQESKK